MLPERSIVSIMAAFITMALLQHKTRGLYYRLFFFPHFAFENIRKKDGKYDVRRTKKEKRELMQKGNVLRSMRGRKPEDALGQISICAMLRVRDPMVTWHNPP